MCIFLSLNHETIAVQHTNFNSDKKLFEKYFLLLSDFLFQITKEKKALNQELTITKITCHQ